MLLLMLLYLFILIKGIVVAPPGHHSLCIQSMDGMLMFFEQDSYTFGRFLPGFLLPGPLVYNPRTDSLLTVSSARQLESYR